MDANELHRLPTEDAPVQDLELASEAAPSVKEGVEVTYVPKQTKEEVIDRLLEISLDPCGADKQELDLLKQTFYKLLKAEDSEKIPTESPQETPSDGAGPESEPVEHVHIDLEARFKEVWSGIKEKRKEMKLEDQREKEENVARKLDILERLRQLSESSSDDTSRTYSEFKKLQQEWNDIRNIPNARANELWRSFQVYAEKFYDLMKLNNEFREYDFRKNLEIKTRLCESAEKLSEENDVVSAFHQLQKLHQEFRATGPVAKDLRDAVWARFKTASSAVNRRHQQFFEAQKEREQHNLDEKTVICEIAEQMEYDTFTTFQQWEDKTNEILALQARWKTIGYAPQKMNVKIFERFRASCDEFFRRKALFYRSVKENMAANLERKKALAVQAESLKDSTDWKATADVLSALQKEWKSIGPVPKKHSDAIWKRFITACDYFFDRKNRASSTQRTAEQDNLIGKKDILQKLNAVEASGETGDEAAEQVRQLMKEWNAIGHVPFKEKDKMYKQYHAVVDKLFERLNLSQVQRRLSSFKGNLGKGDAAYREREKLSRLYENMKSEIQTYENNLGFLSSSSKKGSSLVTEMTRKVEKLKGELEQVREKLRVIDDSLRESSSGEE